MKKILFYTDTPQVGGAELQMFLLAKFLNKEQFTPILACSNYEKLDRWCENFEKEGIKVIRLKVRSKHDPRHYFQLRKILRREKIDLLHLHIWNPASCRYAFLAAGKIPVITTEHDPFELDRIKNIYKKWTLKKVSKIVTVSEENKKLLSRLYPEQKKKLTVIHNGIDITWWQSQTLRFTEQELIDIKEEIFLTNKDSLIIISIAELHERKGLKYLIEAISTLKPKFPNIKLVIIGEGPERSELESQIKKLELEEFVILLGRRKEIPKLLKAANIFALPSRREAFGLVNLEAMITPLPIVATAVGGIPEVVTENGILVPPEDSEALAAVLKKLITSAPLREKLAAAGKKRILSDFDARKMAEKYEKIYQSS